MYRCSSSSCHGNGMGQCSCQGSSFSIFFKHYDHESSMEDPMASSSSVDCTLSLGTPSTRQRDEDRRPNSSSYVSNLCNWDIFQTKQATHASTSHRASAASGRASSDSRVVRRCANCDTTSTPLWRNGPRGPKSLCNACGIRYKKEERRATTSSAAMEAHHLISQHHHHHWGYAGQPQNASPTAVNGEFRLIDDGDDDSSPYLSWRLNVPPPDFPVHMT